MKQILTAIFVILLAVSLLAIAFTINQVNGEQERITNDLYYRSTLLAESFRETIEPNFVNKSDSYLQTVVERYSNRERFAGMIIYDHTGTIVAHSSSLPDTMKDAKVVAANAMDENAPNGAFAESGKNRFYLLATPLHEENRVVGALLVAQNANYIDARITEIWQNNLIRLFIQILLLAVAIFIIIRWLIYEPVRDLAGTLKMARTGESKMGTLPSRSPLFAPLIAEVSNIRRSLTEARVAAIEEARAGLEKMDSPWTAERLRQFIADSAKDRDFVIVSNREPYIHTKVNGTIRSYQPASGMVTAIEPIIRASGGTWIAHGSGDADRLVVDRRNSIQVPPEDPKYVLKRVWLTEEEEKRFYYGFCNEGLWPLCHTAHTRPTFRKEDWEAYKTVNGQFAEAVLSEIKGKRRPIILIQDFHFALLPRLIKRSRPDAIIGLFWHIPWVSAESFSVCPWKKELVDGMLGADLLGFHTQLHCNNFIETVSRELESLIDYEQFSVARHGHTSFIKPFPISIAFSNGYEFTPPDQETLKKRQALLKSAGVKGKYIGIGVDRLDYTKGILERMKAVEIFLSEHPEYQEQFTFVQIAAPSRTKVPRYKQFADEVEKEVDRINDMFKTRNWKPIILLERHHTHEEIFEWYRIAQCCLVTSLHDGMNLVAKEYVAARDDNKGVLILSQFTGASKQLKDALIVNPYNGEQTAEAIYTAITMSRSEQTKRMKKLRESVRNNNVYRWSAEFLRTLIQLE